MPQRDQRPGQIVVCRQVSQPIAIMDIARKLVVFPASVKPAPHRKRDLGAKLKAILAGRFQARGLAEEEALTQADICLGLSLERSANIQPLQRKIVAIR